MTTFASLFSGFAGADLGAMAAGLQLAWGVELMPDIAEVGNANLGQHIKVANILDCTPVDFDRVDVLHASPPCPNFSVAKANGAETALDKALAAKVAEFVTVLQPEVFTLENVQAYRKSRSWATIEAALYKAGYWLNIEICNSADYGVPQTRKRMIARAIRGGFVPYLPQPERWVGWYEAIEDILHTLPDSQFAPWQLERLPEEIKTILVSNAKTEYNDGTRQGGDPAFTGNGESGGRVKAFLIGKHYGSPTGTPNREVQCRGIDEPSMTVTSSDKSECRAFLIDSKNVNQEYGKLYRSGDEPALTVTTDGKPSHMPRAFLMGKNQDKYGDGIRYAIEPAQTIGANEHGSKAFIVDGKNSGNFGNGPTILNGENRIFTIQASQAKGMPRAFDGIGRVVAMTPRALARFQSFPDNYILPESKTLAAKGIGNAVCPLMMEKIYRGLLS